MSYFKEPLEVKIDLDGRDFVLRTDEYAYQAGGAVSVQIGETVVLGVSTMGDAREGIDFLPLMVDVQERWYASGKISGSRFVKREGRPSENATLMARMIDRPMRPLFPKKMTNDIQIICNILSADLVTDPGPAAITAASAATVISGMPFDGPVSGVRVGMKDGEFVLNPDYETKDEGDLDLFVAGTMDAITMVEAGAREISEEKMLEALEYAHKFIKQICEAQLELKKLVNPEPLEATMAEVDESGLEMVMSALEDSKLDEIKGLLKPEVKAKLKAYQKEMIEKFAAQIEAEELTEGEVKGAVQKAFENRMRHNILEKGERLDGRGINDIREVRCRVGVLPRPHGSGIFQRGETQILSVLTLASPDAAQLIDTMDQEVTKRYMHHYNFPPYSVGEVRMMRSAGRREIGHGYLAERALVPVLPSKEDFAYTIRVVSETMTCNGSSSMGSVCGSTLALMDAGVPITRPVSGVAMGLVMDKETGKYQILTDIQGQEDFAGDMDFKVTGTEEGITALQMDIKLKGLDIELMREALGRAKVARAKILDDMLKTLDAPRTELSKYAPLLMSMQIDPDMIGMVIGKGGETIQGITADTGAEISIEDDGLITITADDQESGMAAKARIEQITYVPEPGDEFEGKVVKILEFGAFVEVMPGKDGLVHISELAPHRVDNVNDVLKEGDVIKVKLLKVDDKGRWNFTHKPFFKES
jgi:polyribonucleotide nucleotidyltransferase